MQIYSSMMTISVENQKTLVFWLGFYIASLYSQMIKSKNES
jgi:hypothetical protein